MFRTSHRYPLFQDRHEAGKQLAKRLSFINSEVRPLVLALPRGGVPVASEIAKSLSAELDVFLVRKLGLPGQEELAIGAIATGGVRVLNHDLLRELDLPDRVIEGITARERLELERRERFYREGRAPAVVSRREVLLVDDGLATGATMKAACKAVRLQCPASITVAVPVAAPETCSDLARCADRVVCLKTPTPFDAVGIWYEDFSQITDREVQLLLAEHST